jgi:hypothetical protein
MYTTSESTPERKPESAAGADFPDVSRQQRVDAPRSASSPVDVPSEEPREPREALAGRQWHLTLSVVQDGPIAGHRGPGLGTGGVLAAELALSKPVNIGGGLGGTFQPFGDRHSPIRGGWRIWLEIRMLFLFTAGIVKGGPLLGVDGGINGTIVEDEPYPRRVMTFWNIRGQFGAIFRVAVMGTRWISLASGIAAAPKVVTIRRESNGEVLGRTAVLGWWLRLEMGLF